MSVTEFRKMNTEGLEGELLSSLKELLNLRMQKGTKQLSKPHLLRAVRRRIACLNTLIAEKSRV